MMLPRTVLARLALRAHRFPRHDVEPVNRARIGPWGAYLTVGRFAYALTWCDPPTSPSTRCRCGHPADAHDHYRRGTDCGACGPDVCPALDTTGQAARA